MRLGNSPLSALSPQPVRRGRGSRERIFKPGILAAIRIVDQASPAGFPASWALAAASTPQPMRGQSDGRKSLRLGKAPAGHTRFWHGKSINRGRQIKPECGCRTKRSAVYAGLNRMASKGHTSERGGDCHHRPAANISKPLHLTRQALPVIRRARIAQIQLSLSGVRAAVVLGQQHFEERRVPSGRRFAARDALRRSELDHRSHNVRTYTGIVPKCNPCGYRHVGA